MNPSSALLASKGAWLEAIIWSLPGWVPLLVLWALGWLSIGGLSAGVPIVFVMAGLVCWWRHRQLAPLIDWVDRLRTVGGDIGVVPNSYLYGPLSDALIAVEREFRSLRQQVASSDQLQRSLVDAVPDPVIVVDRRGYVRMANPAAEQHFHQKLLLQPLGRFLRDPGILGAIDSAVRADVSSTVSFSPLLERTRRYTCHIQPMLTAEGDAAAILSLRETSEQVAIERMRSDFIANASHELRTPLTALAGFVETLKGPARDDPEAQAMFLDIMDAEASRMTRLIDDLLSLSKLEADVNRPPADDVDLADVVAMAVSGLEPQLRKNGTVVETQAGEGPMLVRGDQDQLQQLVANLVDNASKYGRPGEAVQVQLARLDPAGDEAGPLSGRPAIRVSVTDHGDGIAPEHLPRLTERFYRVDKSRSRRAGGTGLGLAISKHIIKRHGGHLNVDSQLGEGSRFSVFIPAR